MNEKLKAVCDLLAAFGVSREEVVVLLRQLREQWGISVDELVPESEILNGLQGINSICREVREMLVQRVVSAREDTAGTERTEPAAAESVSKDLLTSEAPQVRKRGRKTASKIAKEPHYSKNGKRLGRPPRVKNETVETAAEIEEQSIAAQEEIAAETDKAFAEAETVAEPAENDAAKDNLPPPAGFDNTIHIVDAEALEEVTALRMGKEYPYGIIYRWKPRLYVRSRYILRDLCPEAVCLDYGQAGKGIYRQFAIATTDEIASMPFKTARAYAASKLPKFEGEVWTVMNFVQAGIAGREAKELNRLLNKLGGDPFRGKYATGEVLNGKIRYAINIK